MSQHDLDTGINDISLAFAGDLVDAFNIADLTWGEVVNSIIVVHDGKTYICDGIDPTTGYMITEEILAVLRARYAYVYRLS